MKSQGYTMCRPPQHLCSIQQPGNACSIQGARHGQNLYGHGYAMAVKSVVLKAAFRNEPALKTAQTTAESASHD